MTAGTQTVQTSVKRTVHNASQTLERARKGQIKPRYHRTPEHEALVIEASEIGLSTVDIARLLHVAQDTVESHYGEVIQEYRAKGTMLAASKLWEAVREGKQGSVQYFLDRRGDGWRPQSTAAPTNAVQVVVNLSDTLRQAMASLEGVKRSDSTPLAIASPVIDQVSAPSQAIGRQSKSTK